MRPHHPKSTENSLMDPVKHRSSDFLQEGVNAHRSNTEGSKGASMAAVEKANKDNEDKVQGNIPRLIATVVGW